MRSVKLRAAGEGRKLKDVVADLIRCGLAQEAGRAVSVRGRPSLPLIECAHSASAVDEMTPERVAEVLNAGDVNALER